MATLGGMLTYICVYGFYIMGALSFFFAPNIVTFGFLCFTVYIFVRKKDYEKEKEK